MGVRQFEIMWYFSAKIPANITRLFYEDRNALKRYFLRRLVFQKRARFSTASPHCRVGDPVPSQSEQWLLIEVTHEVHIDADTLAHLTHGIAIFIDFSLANFSAEVLQIRFQSQNIHPIVPKQLNREISFAIKMPYTLALKINGCLCVNWSSGSKAINFC